MSNLVICFLCETYVVNFPYTLRTLYFADGGNGVMPTLTSPSSSQRHDSLMSSSLSSIGSSLHSSDYSHRPANVGASHGSVPSSPYEYDMPSHHSAALSHDPSTSGRQLSSCAVLGQSSHSVHSTPEQHTSNNARATVREGSMPELRSTNGYSSYEPLNPVPTGASNNHSNSTVDPMRQILNFKMEYQERMQDNPAYRQSGAQHPLQGRLGHSFANESSRPAAMTNMPSYQEIVGAQARQAMTDVNLSIQSQFDGDISTPVPCPAVGPYREQWTNHADRQMTENSISMPHCYPSNDSANMGSGFPGAESSSVPCYQSGENPATMPNYMRNGNCMIPCYNAAGRIAGHGQQREAHDFNQSWSRSVRPNVPLQWSAQNSQFANARMAGPQFHQQTSSFARMPANTWQRQHTNIQYGCFPLQPNGSAVRGMMPNVTQQTQQPLAGLRHDAAASSALCSGPNAAMDSTLGYLQHQQQPANGMPSINSRLLSQMSEHHQQINQPSVNHMTRNTGMPPSQMSEHHQQMNQPSANHMTRNTGMPCNNQSPQINGFQHPPQLVGYVQQNQTAMQISATQQPPHATKYAAPGQQSPHMPVCAMQSQPSPSALTNSMPSPRIPVQSQSTILPSCAQPSTAGCPQSLMMTRGMQQGLAAGMGNQHGTPASPDCSQVTSTTDTKGSQTDGWLDSYILPSLNSLSADNLLENIIADNMSSISFETWAGGETRSRPTIASAARSMGSSYLDTSNMAVSDMSTSLMQLAGESLRM